MIGKLKRAVAVRNGSVLMRGLFNGSWFRTSP